MTVSRRGFMRAVAGTAAVTTAAEPAAAQDAVPDFGGYLEGARGGEVADLRGQSSATVEVGAGPDGLAFAPTGIWIDPGTAVSFEWVSDGHNVVVEDQPAAAGWEGSEGGPSDLYDEGHAFEHTFDTAGVYTYYCAPHESLGMLGGIAVGDDVPTVTPGAAGGEGGGSGDGRQFTLPGGDFGAAIMGSLFGAAGLAVAVVLAGEYGPGLLRRATGDRPAAVATMTPEQYGAFRDGEAVEVTAEDGSTVTVRPPE